MNSMQLPGRVERNNMSLKCFVTGVYTLKLKQSRARSDNIEPILVQFVVGACGRYACVLSLQTVKTSHFCF
jgi:hypothetical protein